MVVTYATLMSGASGCADVTINYIHDSRSLEIDTDVISGGVEYYQSVQIGDEDPPRLAPPIFPDLDPYRSPARIMF